MLEIRAGTGGDEAALFAASCSGCTRMYAERHGWRLEVMSSSDTGGGGLKEVIAMIEGPRRLQQAEVRERRAPRAARAGHRGQRPHPHLHRHGRGAPRGRGSGRPDQRQGPAHRHLLLERPRRPERQHHLLGGSHHAHPQRRGGLAAGREIADQESREGDEGIARAPLRDGASGSSRRRSPRIAAARSAPASDRRKSAPTTSATTASPITASTSPPTGWSRCSTAIWPNCSTT